MTDDRRRILDLLAQGKITADEAEKLLNAVDAAPTPAAPAPSVPAGKAKYLRVLVEDSSKGANTHVNIRVPMQLIRAGVKLSALMPREAQEKIDSALKDKGMQFDLSSLTPETLDQLVEGLNELTVNVDDEETKVRIFCE